MTPALIKSLSITIPRGCGYTFKSRIICYPTPLIRWRIFGGHTKIKISPPPPTIELSAASEAACTITLFPKCCWPLTTDGGPTRTPEVAADSCCCCSWFMVMGHTSRQSETEISCNCCVRGSKFHQGTREEGWKFESVGLASFQLYCRFRISCVVISSAAAGRFAPEKKKKEAPPAGFVVWLWENGTAPIRRCDYDPSFFFLPSLLAVLYGESKIWFGDEFSSMRFVNTRLRLLQKWVRKDILEVEEYILPPTGGSK